MRHEGGSWAASCRAAEEEEEKVEEEVGGRERDVMLRPVGWSAGRRLCGESLST